MFQTSTATKVMAVLLPLFINLQVTASGGDDHTHGPEGDYGMQILGVIIILAIACAGFYFLSKKK